MINKGYQATCDAQGDIYLKVQGTGHSLSRTSGLLVWDAPDIVFPPTENGAVFLTTNFIATYAQARTFHLGDGPDEKCNATVACPSFATPTTHGLSNGTCDLQVRFLFFFF